jgi:MoxR-like ATPase
VIPCFARKLFLLILNVYEYDDFRGICMDLNRFDASFVTHLQEESLAFQELRSEIARVVIGQREAVDFILMAILCKGHILLEGIPGVAKTTLIKTVAHVAGLNFKRIQFTPDLLPSDLTGTSVYNPQTQEFGTRKGPLFSNLILADEINRAPAKVHAALLEAMQEQQVTIGQTTFELEDPFLVCATQNPLDQEGTYRLPEAQIDRFMFKVVMGYPSIVHEKEIVRMNVAMVGNRLLDRDRVLSAQKAAEAVYVDDKIVDYIIALVFATRVPETYNLQSIKHALAYGVSPRATQALYHAARACAFLKGRHFVTPDDVKEVVPAVFRHRLVLTYEADVDGLTSDSIIKTLLATVYAP